MKNRLFLYAGENHKYFGKEFWKGEIYPEELILNVNENLSESLGEWLDFYFKSGLTTDDFIQVDNLNNNIGAIICALKDACEIRGLKVDVNISTK